MRKKWRCRSFERRRKRYYVFMQLVERGSTSLKWDEESRYVVGACKELVEKVEYFEEKADESDGGMRWKQFAV